jgi:hypothetical protein
MDLATFHRELGALWDRALLAWRHAARDDWAAVEPFVAGAKTQTRNAALLRARVLEGATLRGAGKAGGISAERLRQIEVRSAVLWMHHANPAWRTRLHALCLTRPGWGCRSCGDPRD